MKSIKKIMTFLVFLLPISLSAGCQFPKERVEVILKPPSTEQQSLSTASLNRFQESASKGPTVVESVLELSEKYAGISEELAAERQKNQTLLAENRRFENELAVYKAQLKQAQKELTEANDLLIEMRIELNNWKTDILGFRDEMRDADQAQLEALLRILKTLGGEIKTESNEAQNADSDAMETNSGEQNE
jgi:L-2-hydroxyglutarate oxidase LhgO